MAELNDEGPQNKRLERTRHDRPSLVSCVGEPLKRNVMLLRLSLIIALLAMASCVRSQVTSQQINAATPPSTPSAEPSPSPSPLSGIYKIDFENFAYPAAPVYSKNEKPFTLKDGEYSGRLQDGGVEPEPVYLVDTIYGDVTGDGVEDAIVVLTVSIRGTAIPYYVYIYEIERAKPKLLWSFETGDRADGGLRRIVAENGKLLVELYGKDIYVGGNYYSGSGGACCPSNYTRSRYEWKQNQFKRMGQFEVFPNEGGAPYLPLLEKR